MTKILKLCKSYKIYEKKRHKNEKFNAEMGVLLKNSTKIPIYM